ncbi:MAG: DNA primase small subunit domain-containing protein [Candidatus Bathyarchaeia archaeon]
MKSAEFIQSMFRDYYSRDTLLNCSVSMVERREFGFLSFEGQMLRHKSFQGVDELKHFLKSFIPKDAYFSCAYYENPEAEMEMKGWLGADLIFDIDADHIPTSCDKVHDEWRCGNCGFVGKGVTPEKCPVCGGEKFDVNTWPCEDCLASAKAETVKLLEMLMEDFGFSEREIRTFFSGHRGYHVHVESDSVKTLDAMERKEIVDYVSALGLNIESHVLGEAHAKESAAFQTGVIRGCGWPKRLMMGLQDFIANACEKDFLEAGLERRFIVAVTRNRSAILKSLQAAGSLGYVKGVGSQTWAKIVRHVVKLRAANIDTVVTTDVHRLIRLSDTLNGKTGFKKVEFPVSAIDSFDPFKMAVAFKEGFVNVKVYDAPKFRLGEETFGPYKNQRVELPTAAAVLLICRNRAEVIA